MQAQSLPAYGPQGPIYHANRTTERQPAAAGGFGVLRQALESGPLTESGKHEEPLFRQVALPGERPVFGRDVVPLFSGDESLEFLPPVSDASRGTGLLYTLDYDSFRGVPDGGWGNTGIRAGFNFGTSLGRFSELTGVGLQIGASVGVYDWAGTDYRLQHQSGGETQGFFTYGLFRRPTDGCRIVGGLVQDWSVNNAFGVFGENPTLSQLRGQLGYAVSASNEFGVWGATHLTTSTRNVPYFGATKWQSIDQLSGYWHHKWSYGGPDTWISVGAPGSSRLSGGGSVGDYVVTALANAPLNNSVSVYSSVTYMHQSSRPSPSGADDEAWNFSVGICIFPRSNARSATVAGQRWMPLMPVANNGSFLVDQSQIY